MKPIARVVNLLNHSVKGPYPFKKESKKFFPLKLFWRRAKWGDIYLLPTIGKDNKKQLCRILAGRVDTVPTLLSNNVKP